MGNIFNLHLYCPNVHWPCFDFQNMNKIWVTFHHTTFLHSNYLKPINHYQIKLKYMKKTMPNAHFHFPPFIDGPNKSILEKEFMKMRNFSELLLSLFKERLGILSKT